MTRTARFGHGVCLAAALSLTLSGCAPGAFSTQSQRIGPDDGTDSCRPQLVALDSTGDFFGAQILTGAAVGALGGALAGGLIGGNWQSALIGAAAGGVLGGTVGYWSALQQQRLDQGSLYAHVQGDLSRENAAIDKTQLAFNQLMDCRFNQAASIRYQYRLGNITRATAEAQMAFVRQHAQRDLALAQQINGQIQNRAQQFDVATDNLSPGASAAASAQQAAATRSVTLRRSVPLQVTPNPGAPTIAQVSAREQVTVTPISGGDYALVTTSSGQKGYVPASDVGTASRAGAAGAADNGDVRTLAGSNAARRDTFAQSVSVSQQAVASGFEIAG